MKELVLQTYLIQCLNYSNFVSSECTQPKYFKKSVTKAKDF